MNPPSKSLIRFLRRVISGGMPENPDIETQLRVRVMNIISILTILILIVFGLTALKKGNPLTTLFDLSVAFIFIVTQIYWRRTRRYDYPIYFWVSSTGVLFIYLYISGGVDNTGHLWGYIFPLVAAFLLGPRWGAIAILAFLASLILLWMVQLSQGLNLYSEGFTVRFIASFSIISFSACFYERFRRETQEHLTISNLELDKQITKLKETEEALEKNQDELEQRVRDRTAELTLANTILLREIDERQQLENRLAENEERLQRAEKMEALGTLAGGVAHDLNNVLGIVVGYAELLLMDQDESSSIRPNLLNIMSGSQRAAAIVQDLLTLARRGVSGRKVLNLNRIVVDSQQSPEFENLSSYHPSTKIRTELEPDLLNISGSSVHLGKTLFNMVSNATEAMPNGGTVTINTTNQYLDKPIQGYEEIQEGDYVVLSVSDTGEGISATDLKHIFEPFYTKKVMGRSGTGLGLAVVWGTVKDHNGYINVKSEEGKGSTFTLYFPATREDISAEAAAVSISEYIGHGESILIVDDVKGQRDLAATMLRKLNYNVASVSSGEEAVAYLKEHNVDLMVLDMIMDPGMDGLDTYKKVLEIHPQQKAIIASGFSETDRVITAQTLGVGAYVRKPYVIEKLGLAVKNELDRT